MRAATSLCLALTALTALPKAAQSDPVPAPSDPAPVVVAPAVVAPAVPTVDLRMSLLERDATHARIWYWGFVAAYGAGAVGETLYGLFIEDQTQRINAAVGAASAWLAVGGMAISPVPRVWRAAEEARRAGDAAAGVRPAAEAESTARAWYNHVAVGAVAVAAGLVLWLGFDCPGWGALNFAENLVIGELNLLTIPTRSARFRDGTFTWHLAPSANGLSLAGTW